VQKSHLVHLLLFLNLKSVFLILKFLILDQRMFHLETQELRNIKKLRQTTLIQLFQRLRKVLLLQVVLGNLIFGAHAGQMLVTERDSVCVQL